jgi:D-alanine-D-alanine ligase
MGGNSNEREVSLSTGQTAAQYFDRKKFNVLTYDTKNELVKLLKDIREKKIDVCFIALHGKGGEDGSIQGLLEIFEIPYTGSGIMASALAMNKVFTKRLLSQAGIINPPAIIFSKDAVSLKEKDCQDILKKIKNKLGQACVIKPSDSGSSVGVTIARNDHLIIKGIKKAFKEDKKIIVEKYIKGKELTVGVLGNKDIQVLPVVEILPKKEFFDYQAKYNPKYCQEIAPARIPEDVSKKAQELAKSVYRLLGCRGFARIDMIWAKEKIYVLEANTIPGLTPASLLPKAAQAADITFSELLTKIVNFALEND